MPWLQLFRAEATGLRRGLAGAVRANPLLMLLVPGVALGVLYLAARAGTQLGTLASVPGGTAVVGSLVLLVLGLGIAIGAVLTALAPTFDGLDEQVRSLPISGRAGFIGVTGLPLLVAWLALAAPLVAFGWSLYGAFGVNDAALWAALLAAGQVVASIAGGAVAEGLRRRVTTRSLLVVLFVVGAAATLAIVVPDGAARLIPLESGDADPSLVAAGGLTVAAAIAAATAWLVFGSQELRRRASSGAVRSWRLRGNPLTVIGGWLALTAWRHSGIRVQAVLALLASLFGVAVLALLLGPTSEPLVPALLVTLMLIAASAPLLLSHPAAQGSWLLRTVPIGLPVIGATWWVGMTALSLAITIAAVAPFALVYPAFAGFAIFAAVVMAPIPAVIGRLLPWQPMSMFRQVVIAVVVAGSYALALAAATALGREVGGWTGGWLGGELIALLVAVAAVWVAAASFCAMTRWSDA